MSRTVYLETFGCQMNELDSELVAGQLRALGYRFTPNRDTANVVLFNTCSVRERAEQKVWSRLGELKERKKTDPALVVGVLGCLAERDGIDLIRRMPVVDILVGPGELDKLPSLPVNLLSRIFPSPPLSISHACLSSPSPCPTSPAPPSAVWRFSPGAAIAPVSMLSSGPSRRMRSTAISMF